MKECVASWTVQGKGSWAPNPIDHWVIIAYFDHLLCPQVGAAATGFLWSPAKRSPVGNVIPCKSVPLGIKDNAPLPWPVSLGQRVHQVISDSMTDPVPFHIGTIGQLA